MMTNKILTLLVCMFVASGCAMKKMNQWSTQRKSEIQLAYDNNEITKAEYLSLMNEVDASINNYRANLKAGALSD